MPRLVISHKGHNYKIIDLSERVDIGRDEQNDIVLQLAGISRNHASLVPDEKGNYQLVDRNSTNGTWLRGKRIKRHQLRHSDTFFILDYAFSFIEDQEKQEQIGPAQPQRELTDQTILIDRDHIQELLHKETGSPTHNLLTDIHGFLKKLGACSSEETLFSMATDTLATVFQTHCTFFAEISTNQRVTFRYFAGGKLNPEEIRRGRKLVLDAIKSGQIQKVSHKNSANTRGGEDDTAWICVPMQQNQGTLGAICLVRKQQTTPFSAEECELIDIVAGHLTLLHEKIKEGQEISLQPATDGVSFCGIVARSEVMSRLCNDIETIAPINAPVLILGESGSGKELVAHALHKKSGRPGPLVTLNCSAIPEGIFESELFGSVRGAFHNAVDRAGSLEQADGGTIFLDEIGDMSLKLQPKLLRFLETRELTRLGDIRHRKVDVRIIAATNQDLTKMIRDKIFRADLYQRLCCFKLSIAPLRDRIEDIALLTNHFLHEYAREYSWPCPSISPMAIAQLNKYHWPGNVRELRNIILRLCVNCRGRTVKAQDVRQLLQQADDEMLPGSFKSMEDMEKQHIQNALKITGWNASAAARLLGIARSTLYQKIKKYHINMKQ